MCVCVRVYVYVFAATLKLKLLYEQLYTWFLQVILFLDLIIYLIVVL